MTMQKEDYTEPCCPLDMHPEEVRIPLGRITEKLDYLFEKKDFSAARLLLKNWIYEADAVGDMQGKLTLFNEQIGLYRKLNEENDCLDAINSALELSKKLDFEKTVTGATTFINAATGYKAFKMAEKALPLYQKAREVYEKLLPPSDSRLAGLYNNMGLALCDLREYEKAETLYNTALEIDGKNPHGEAEAAITLLNLADLVYSRDGAEKSEKAVEEYLTRAEKLLDTETLPQDGYYAFVCEKCAPVFGFYGYFLTEQKFMKKAEAVYERS